MTLSAVLLAGGESRRMGRDKATMVFAGERLWERQLATLRQIGAKEIIVSARTDPAWRPNDIAFVADVGQSHGPWSGLAATLAQISTTHLLALAIDMPFMTLRFLNSLREQAEPGRGVVPRIGERYEPLAAIYPREVDVDLPPSPGYGATGARAQHDCDFSLQGLIKRLVAAGKVSVVNVAPADERLFRNLNQPGDLVEARE